MGVSQAERDRVEPVLAMDIERLLIWTYQDQAADAIIGRAAGTAAPMTRGISNASMIANHIALGCRVDVSRGGAVWAAGVACDLHPDAEATHEAVTALPSILVGMVIRHAKGGTRPDWCEGVMRRPVAIKGGNGKPVVIYKDRARNYPDYCPLTYLPHADWIRDVRKIWLAWWDALDDIAGRLDGTLERKVLRLPFQREPWLVEGY
ncbi:hypothetical protein [Shumkonia mesophila]|uniref:hypothetical protein n=1 Tax=Shumkonia mesophila TaxID=2838854 RepID=UPI002934B086|nr:hypothetical protein [Shumkonia mesophila]